MAARRKTGIDFESRYFDELEDWREEVDGDLKKINTELFGPQKKSDLPPWYRDPKWLNILFIGSIIMLVLVLGATRIDPQAVQHLIGGGK